MPKLHETTPNTAYTAGNHIVFCQAATAATALFFSRIFLKKSISVWAGRTPAQTPRAPSLHYTAFLLYSAKGVLSILFFIILCKRRSVNPSEKIRCRRACQIPPITPFPRNVCKKRSIGAQKTKAAHPPAAAFALRVRAWKAKFSSVLRTCGHTPARPPRRAAPPSGTPTAR